MKGKNEILIIMKDNSSIRERE
jgi:signal transduction histidine kinase